MTLERLRFKQFGPYATPQDVDFSDFAGHQLFLIHGATGAGKSFVLDAICYALYSESSGAERDATDLRSHYATPDDPTEVTLDFRLGDKRYRVWRRPRMELAKKRGEGTTTRGPDAELYDRTDIDRDAKRDAPGTLIAEGKRDVTDRIESLLGLQVDQFRQVVVLPQGQFRAFLAADSSKREDILKVLFDTERFADLEDELKAMHAEAKQDAKALLDQRSALLTQHDVETPAALRSKQEACAEALSEARDTHADVTARLSDAEEALQTARDQQQLLDAVEEAQERVEALRDEQEAQHVRKAQARAAERAQRIESAAVRMRDQKAARDRAKEARSDAQEAYKEAEKARDNAQSELEREQAKSEERNALETQINTLDAARLDVAALSEARETRASTRKTYNEAVEEKEALLDNIEALEKQISEAESVIEAHKEEAEAVPERTSAVKTWKQRLKNARQLAQTNEALQEAEETLSAAQERVARHADVRDAKKEQVRELERARDEGFASVLAAQLEAGTPCPVCGSTAHPAPADATRDVPDAKTLERAREALDDAESALQDARKKQTAAQRAVDKYTSRVEALQDTDAILTEHTVAEIEAKHQDAQEALASAEQAQSTVEEATERRDAVSETLRAKREALDAKKDAVREAKSTHEKAASDVERLADSVPEGIESTKELEERIATLQDELDAYTEALEAAEAQMASAKTEHTRAEANLENARAQSAAAHEAYQEAETAFREALHEQGFEDRTAYEDAQMEADALEALRNEIQAVDKQWSTAQSELQTARARAEDIEPPDVEGAQEQVRKLKARLSELDQQIGGLESTSNGLRRALKRLKKIEDQAAEAERRVERIGHLSQVAGGKGRNERNISLQRYVLAARLKDVLKVANTHLQRMSQNQYHLKRATTLSDARRSGGLDLRVHDAYTNEERPVSTLSGGEGFNAALSLALGLSDVVQRRTGGRRLNTLFIDEGFGTLDQDTLERALDVLSDVQKRQQGRLLGIISHVTELKRRLPARLTVRDAQDGSRLRVEV
ncbi:MAG: SMC family ATPase [Longimonas sp.]|uniref:SMC family ATPase n=1 Tax=Longimonas sp. TaxID=2039626 RepID=UPI003346AE47